jgi:acyl carrier protein
MASDKIKSFLTQRLLVEFGGDVTDDSDLFQLGLIDSYAYIELIRFLESEFSLKISDEELLSNVMVSVSSMIAWLGDKVSEMSLERAS